MQSLFSKDNGNVDAATADLKSALTQHALVADAIREGAGYWTSGLISTEPLLQSTVTVVWSAKVVRSRVLSLFKNS